MENNKYYTPEIEEFRVGFEYERMNGDTWEKDELGEIDCFGTHARGYENEFEEICMGIRSVRVKYLDTQDIEELGFELTATYGDYIEANNNLDKTSTSSIKVLFNTESKLMDIEKYYLQDQSSRTLFDGKILNKSELKWILTKVGVL